MHEIMDPLTGSIPESQDAARLPGSYWRERTTACTNFHCHINRGLGKHTHTGFNGKGDEKPFVCRDAIQEYWNREKIRDVLDSDNNTTSNAEDIESSYLEIFSILCYIDRLSYIGHFTTLGISDARLPIPPNQPADAWPKDEGFREVWSATYKAQWMFKPLIFDIAPLLHRRELCRELILPLEYTKASLTPPTSDESAVFKVAVHPCCMTEAFKKAANSSTDLAFKMVDSNHEPLWDNEIAAYTIIANKSARYLSGLPEGAILESAVVASPFNHIPRYFGSFKWLQPPGSSRRPGQYGICDKPYVIMLEYAPGGNLAAFCQREPEHIMSSHTKDRLYFWFQMFHLLQALGAIHSLGG